MGNFSYISKNREEAILNPWHMNTLCELQLLINGKVVEKIRGIYNGYGAVDVESKFEHLILVGENIWKDITSETFERMKKTQFSGDAWLSEKWDSIVDLHFGEDITCGIAAWHLDSMKAFVPDAKERSKDDPYQGDLFNHYDEEEEESDGLY